MSGRSASLKKQKNKQTKKQKKQKTKNKKTKKQNKTKQKNTVTLESINSALLILR